MNIAHVTGLDPETGIFELFDPSSGETKQVRLVALPGGNLGVLEVSADIGQELPDQVVSEQERERRAEEDAEQQARLRELEERGERGTEPPEGANSGRRQEEPSEPTPAEQEQRKGQSRRKAAARS